MIKCPTPSNECLTVFDCFTSENGFAVFTSDRSTVVQPPYSPSVQYALHVPWVKCDGTRLDGDGVFLSLYDEITFDGQDNAGSIPMNWYLWSPPSDDPAPTYEWGSQTDFDNGDGLCSITLDVDASQFVNFGPQQTQLVIPNQDIASVDTPLFEQMSNNAWNFNGTDENWVSIVSDGTKGRLRIEHRANELDPQNGTWLIPKITGNAEKYSLQMRIGFANNFDHGGTDTSNNSGKLGFGLAGGRQSNGSFPVTGGSTDTSGYSARLGFDVIDGAMRLIGYLYYANRPGMPSNSNNVFGDFVDTGIDITPGQEIFVTHQVVHNTPGNNDGEWNLWNGNTQVVNMTGIRWMDGTPEGDLILLSSWHGGDINFAPPQNTHVDYCDVSLFKSAA